jgi:hypothetical protein
VILKIVRKAGYDMYLGENWPLAAKESKNIDSEAAFGPIFRTSNCFQRSKQRLNSYFSLSQGRPSAEILI